MSLCQKLKAKQPFLRIIGSNISPIMPYIQKQGFILLVFARARNTMK